jgi:hypothetical protein
MGHVEGVLVMSKMVWLWRGWIIGFRRDRNCRFFHPPHPLRQISELEDHLTHQSSVVSSLQSTCANTVVQVRNVAWKSRCRGDATSFEERKFPGAIHQIEGEEEQRGDNFQAIAEFTDEQRTIMQKDESSRSSVDLIIERNRHSS